MSSGMFAASALSAVPFRDNAASSSRSTNATMIDLTNDSSDDSNDEDGGYFREDVASTSTARPPPPPPRQRPRQPQVVEVLSDSDNDDEDIIEVDRHGARVPPSSQPSQTHQVHVGMPDIRPLPRRHPMAVAPFANDAARRRHMQTSQHQPPPAVNATRHHHAASGSGSRAGGGGAAVPRAGFGGALLTLGGNGGGGGAGPSRHNRGNANPHPVANPVVRPPANRDDTFRNLARHTLRRRLAYIPLHNPLHQPPNARNPFDINDDGGARLGVGGDGFFNLAQLANAWGMGMGWGEVDEEQARARAVADIPVWDPDARAVHGGRKRAREGFTWDFDAVREEEWDVWKPVRGTMGVISGFVGGDGGSGSGSGVKAGEKRKAETIIDVSDSSSSSSDLDSDAESESGSEADLPTLICAGCDTPLVMGGEAEDEKIWGLRCGHLICGGCLARIGTPLPLPPPPPPPATKAAKVKKERTTSGQRHSTRLSAAVKGKGKARAVEDDVADEEMPLESSPPASGRVLRSAPSGSASASASGPSTASRSTRASRSSNQYGLDADDSGDESDTGMAPTSSRTRSSTRPSSSHPAPTAPSTPSPAKPKTPKKRKGKGKATIRTFREYEYACPVEDCLRLHTRVLVGTTVEDAKWRGKDGEGEVGVYTG